MGSESRKKKFDVIASHPFCDPIDFEPLLLQIRNGEGSSASPPTDITLIVGPPIGGEPPLAIDCHRFILHIRSPFFRTLFESKFRDATSSEVELPLTGMACAESRHLHRAAWIVLRFMYGCEVILDRKSIFCVQELADFFGLDDLRWQTRYLVRRMCALTDTYCTKLVNRLTRFALFEQMFPALVERIANLCCQNWFEGKACDKLLPEDCSEVAVLKLLHDESFIAPEVAILQEVTHWASKQSAVVRDRPHYKAILDAVRLNTLHPTDFEKHVTKSGLFSKDRVLTALLESTAWCFADMAASSNEGQQPSSGSSSPSSPRRSSPSQPMANLDERLRALRTPLSVTLSQPHRRPPPSPSKSHSNPPEGAPPQSPPVPPPLPSDGDEASDDSSENISDGDEESDDSSSPENIDLSDDDDNDRPDASALTGQYRVCGVAHGYAKFRHASQYVISFRPRSSVWEGKKGWWQVSTATGHVLYSCASSDRVPPAVSVWTIGTGDYYGHAPRMVQDCHSAELFCIKLE